MQDPGFDGAEFLAGAKAFRDQDRQRGDDADRSEAAPGRSDDAHVAAVGKVEFAQRLVLQWRIHRDDGFDHRSLFRGNLFDAEFRKALFHRRRIRGGVQLFVQTIHDGARCFGGRGDAVP